MRPDRAYLEFERAVQAAGLKARLCSDYHWQVIGGKFVVNVFPSKARVHVQGQAESRRFWSTGELAPEAIRLANAMPKLVPHRDRDHRPGDSYRRRVKATLLRGDPHCRWRKAELTMETATLEHIVPIARGGSAKSMDNLALSCEPCNKAHGNGANIEKPDFKMRTKRAQA